MDVLREVHSQHLTCGICMDQYTEPKQLPCLHSFCKRCLTSHILKSVAGSGSVFFKCPVCRTECKSADPDPNNVLGWSESFPDNFFIRSLIATFEARSRDIETVHESLESLSAEPESCPTHRKETSVAYCVLKNTGLCGLCLTTSMHDDCAHSHLTPEDARDFAGRNLTEFKLRVEALSSRVMEIEARLTTKPSEFKFTKEELAIDISDYFSDMKTKLNKLLLQKEKDVLDDLNKAIHKEMSKVLEAKDETKSLSGSLKGTIQLFDKLMEDRPVGVLAVAQTVEKQIASYEQATMKLEDHFCKEMDIKLHKGRDIIGTIDNLPWGKLQTRKEVLDTEIIPPVVQSFVPVDVSQSQPDRTPIVHQKLSYYIDSDRRVNNAYDVSQDEIVASGGASISGALPSSRMHSAQISREQTSPSDESISEQPVEESSRRTAAGTAQQPPRLATSVEPNPTSATSVRATPFNAQSLDFATSQVQVPLTASATAQLHAPQDGDFNLRLVTEFRGLCPEDTHSASYVGMTPFGENCLLLLDRWNKKLKLVQIGGRLLLVFQFDMSMEPWDVTCDVSGENVAVTCPGFSHFAMMSASTSSIQISRLVKTVIGYSSLVHLHGNTFAAGLCKPFGTPRVDIVDAAGREATVLTQLSASMTYPRTLQRTLDGELFVCDWSRKEVTVFDSGDFSQIFRYKGDGTQTVFREPVSATKDRKGNIYVADRKLMKVFVVSRTTGKMLAVLPIDIPSDPKVIVIVDSERHYSSQGEVLVVATGGGKLFVYELTTP